MNTKLSKSVVTSRLKRLNKRRARCAKCKKARTHMNPLAKCWRCKNKFCYDHINCLQINDTMKKTDKLRDICDDCKKEHGYQDWKEYNKK